MTSLLDMLKETDLRVNFTQHFKSVSSRENLNPKVLQKRSTNRLEDQEIAVLSLHLLQSCLVYVNTLMIQEVLSEPEWMNLMQPDDLRALTPLIWSHVNPYGIFRLNLDERLPIQMVA